MEVAGYKLQQKIGEGGMSEVYLAEQLSLKRTVAIKFLSEQLLNHPTARELFENEPLIVARLNHPKIIHVIDKGVSSDSKPYFVMEYVEGTTLHDLVQDQKVNLSQKIQYLIQICRGLNFAHKNSIIHRDIKPANIIIDNENNARILDFGIASFYTDDRFVQKSTQVIGTERYMAPEVKTSSANATILSDLYALGVLMFEVFTENFVDKPSVELLESVKLPKSVKKLMMQCLLKDPTQRPTSAKVIENQLLHIIKGAHLAASQKQSAEQDVASLSKKFTLLDVLNESEFSIVYLYEKNNSHDLIVIKKRQHDSSGLKEAKLLSNLKHNNIVNIHGTASNQRAFIIVMDYLPGGTLAERLAQPFTLEAFNRIAFQVLEGIRFAHRNRIFHGNIRPSNILFADNGEVKIADFGLAEHYQSLDDIENWYYPPMVEPVNIPLDIFAMGAVFYHMLTGEPLAWKRGQIDWNAQFKKLPKDYQDWLKAMLEKDPAIRPQRTSIVLKELREISQSPIEENAVTKVVATLVQPRLRVRKSNPFFKVLRWSSNLFWIIVFAVTFTYIQAALFFPEFKSFLHHHLKDFLLWLAEKL